MRPAETLLVVLLLAGCSSAPYRTPPLPPLPPPSGDVHAIPEPIPQAEPRSARGNPKFYTVLGRRYFVLETAEGYLERGVASWYGPGFHASTTSNGERYDMYAMTAAHKTLPLPAYVQVTNLRNGRSVVVRVNDRGPFKDGRIIDLSYTAASKLDMLKVGTTFVEVRALTPAQKTAPPAPPRAPEALFVQAGAFGTQENASRLLDRLRAEGVAKSFVREDTVNGRTLYRVRVGPIPSVNEFDRVLARLRSLGLADAQLAE
jgi:rare lipoprotein A